MSLPCIVLASKPEVPSSTMIEVSSRFPSFLIPVLANGITPAVMSDEPLVINILLPFITHSSSSRTAVVCEFPASDPALGSVSPKAQRVSPLHAFGRYFFFCSSFP